VRGLGFLIHLMQAREGLDNDTILSLLEFRRLAAVFIVRKAVRNSVMHSRFFPNASGKPLFSFALVCLGMTRSYIPAPAVT
jgi:hypothetical protein